MYRFLIVVAISLLPTYTLMADLPLGATDKTVKVYILAGQSNMEEKAGLKPLAWQVGQAEYRDRYTHLIKDGDHARFTTIYNESLAKDPQAPVYNLAERKDVWISNHGTHSNLNAGYMGAKFGAEINFAHEMGNQYDEQVLVIKTAWGGRSIHRGYRSPSGMPSEAEFKSQWAAITAAAKAKKAAAIAAYPKKLEAYEKKLAQYNKAKAEGTLKGKQKAPKKPGDPNASKGKGPSTLEEYIESHGKDYRNMISEVKAALANIKTNHPGYKGQGYEIKGFVWFQGYNDMFAEEARNNYAKNLVKLINDVKKELNAPRMKTVIGQMGHNGDAKGIYPASVDKQTGEKKLTGNGAIRKAQYEASLHADIKDSTALVRTAPFWDMEADAIYTGPGSYKADVAKWQHFGADRPYHYYGSPWFFSQAGTAFGRAMIQLEGK